MATNEDDPSGCARPAATVAGSPAHEATLAVVGAGGDGELPIIPVANYALGDELARGGMGRILRAQDLRLKRPVAIKELLAQAVDFRPRFEREAMITARLQHPAIVPIYEAGRWPSGEPFYTMKLVSGRPLDKLIHEARTMPERIALLPNVIAMAEALAYAHDSRVVHRDLKPQNVLVGDFGETIVIDWGLAKDLASPANPVSSTTSPADDVGSPPADAGARSTAATLAGSVIGTPAYMPPEQARGEPVDERADVYALGAVLYHLLAAQAPYEGRNSAAVLKSVLAEPPRPLDEVEPEVPPDLTAIVAKAMARDPAERYPTAKQLVDDLKRFETGQLVGVHRYSLRQLLGRWARKHRGTLVVAAAALVTLAAIGVFAVSRVVAANRVAQEQRDEAQAQRKTAIDAQHAADTARAAAEQTSKDMLREKDRHRFMRDRRVAMNHFKHTQMHLRSVPIACGDCHVVDAKTLSLVPGTPGHDQCAACHTTAALPKLAMDNCASCHAHRQAASDTGAVHACESEAERALRERIEPGKNPDTGPCFRHERVEHRFRDKARTQVIACDTCHRVIADRESWGADQYETLQDLQASSLLLGTTDNPHAVCTEGCHVHDQATRLTGGRCDLCHAKEQEVEW